ncbi:MAG: hypothetical protein ABI680_18225 [Chthoniobacteraceae bacterium]
MFAALALVTRLSAQAPPFDREAFEKRLKTATNLEAYEIVRTAFEKKDIETLLACNDAGETQRSFLRMYRRSKDEELKARLAERMLRNETLWPPDPPPTVVRSRQTIASYYILGMICEAISGRLGNVSSVEDLHDNAQLRIRLADRLQASLSGSKPATSASEPSVDLPPRQDASLVEKVPPP